MARKYAIRIAVGVVAVVAVFVAVFMALVQFIPFDAGKLQSSTTPTVIYAETGKALLTIPAPGGSDLNYNQIPKDLQNALVSTEDHTFWQGSSIDAKGILRAAFVDLWSHSLAQGGSTIQEQLAKIVYLNDQKTITRKIRQVVLGVQIDRHFTKQEILAMYFNKIYLGENTTGVEQAAQRYFGINLAKDPHLTLDQAALLAGLPQAPSAYDPLQNPQAAMTRRNEVLQNMVKYGYIPQATATKAEKAPLGVSYHHITNDPWNQNPLLLNFVYDYLQNHLGNNQSIIPAQLNQGGLKIYTTIEPNVQNAINKVFWSTNYNGNFPGPTKGTVVQGAAVFVDPKTGGILGAAGSRKQGFVPFGYDRVYATSSPGSSIKPIIDYGPAIQSGQWTPSSILHNQPQSFNGYKPVNWDPSAPSRVTLQYGITWSQNIASVWLLDQLGISTGIKFAENDGITFTPQQKQELCVAIGCESVSPIQMAQAYEPFDNSGQQMPTYLVNRIVNSQGAVIYQHPAAQPHTVMTPQTAATMTQLMQSVVQNGTGQYAQIPGWGVAGKTGTVQYDSNQTLAQLNWVRTGWFDGYTPNMVGSIYIAYDQTDAQHHLSWVVEDPSGNCAQLWHDIVNLAVQGQKPQQFQYPQLSQNTQPQQSVKGVVGLQANWDATNNAVLLSWNTDAKNSPTFVIERATTGTAPSGGGLFGNLLGNSTGSSNQGTSQLEQIGSVSGTSFEDTNVTPGTTYTYVVQAMDPNSETPIGQPAAITFTVPGGPGGGPGGPGNATGGAQGGQGNTTGTGQGTGNSTNQTGSAPGTGTGNATTTGGTTNSTNSTNSTNATNSINSTNATTTGGSVNGIGNQLGG